MGRLGLAFWEGDVGTAVKLTPLRDVDWPELRLCYDRPLFYQPALDYYQVSRGSPSPPSLLPPHSPPLQSCCSSSSAPGILSYVFLFATLSSVILC